MQGLIAGVAVIMVAAKFSDVSNQNQIVLETLESSRIEDLLAVVEAPLKGRHPVSVHFPLDVSGD
jgi:hypothetical protein